MGTRIMINKSMAVRSRVRGPIWMYMSVHLFAFDVVTGKMQSVGCRCRAGCCKQGAEHLLSMMVHRELNFVYTGRSWLWWT